MTSKAAKSTKKENPTTSLAVDTVTTLTADNSNQRFVDLEGLSMTLRDDNEKLKAKVTDL